MLPHILPSEEAFDAALSTVGIKNKDGAVVYDDLQIKGEHNKNHENRRKTSLENKTQEFAESVSDVPKDRKGALPKKQTPTIKPTKPSRGHSDPVRPMKPTFGQKLNNDEVKRYMTLSSRKIYHIRTSKVLNLAWNKSDI